MAKHKLRIADARKLKIGDLVWYGEQRLIVRSVNAAESRVLVEDRGNQTHWFDCESLRVGWFRVNVDQLHVDDWVWLGDRRMIVRQINVDEQRVLIGGRKHSCGNCDLQWVDASELRTKPKSLRKKIKTINELPGEIGEAIDWEPDRLPAPTFAPPGSELKIEILRMRVERGEHLWSENDCRTKFRSGNH